MVDILAQTVDIECPQCRVKVSARLRDIEQGRTVRCSRGHEIRLKDEGRGLAKIDRAFKDLERSVKRVGGTLR